MPREINLPVVDKVGPKDNSEGIFGILVVDRMH